MPIKDLVKPEWQETSTASEPPPGITCSLYRRSEGKRCLHFLPGGACALPGQPVCSEWQKANPHRPHPTAASTAPTCESPQPDRGDLFGQLLPDTPIGRAAPRPAPLACSAPHPAPEVRDLDSEPIQAAAITPDDIESFRALGAEVLLSCKACDELWLVPAYTGAQRNEITPEHAATLARFLAVFPRSRLVSFEKASTPSPSTERSERPAKERS